MGGGGEARVRVSKVSFSVTLVLEKIMHKGVVKIMY